MLISHFTPTQKLPKIAQKNTIVCKEKSGWVKINPKKHKKWHNFLGPQWLIFSSTFLKISQHFWWFPFITLFDYFFHNNFALRTHVTDSEAGLTNCVASMSSGDAWHVGAVFPIKQSRLLISFHFIWEHGQKSTRSLITSCNSISMHIGLHHCVALISLLIASSHLPAWMFSGGRQ